MRRAIVAAAILVGLAIAHGGPADAADSRGLKCLNRDQQRSAVNSGRAVPLSVAIKSSKRRNPGEVLRARLCERPDGSLVYLLTALARNGKVVWTEIRAADGAYAGER